MNTDIKEILYEVLNSNLVKIVFGGQRKKTGVIKKAILRPVIIKDTLLFQLETFTEKQAFHKNLNYENSIEECLKLVDETFKQINIFTLTDEIQILAAKPEKPRITKKSHVCNTCSLSHNKEKQYLIPDDEPCDFLIELGVMGHDGKVFKKHYSKFRQINRYLEIVEDSLYALSTNNTLKIIDFGCGKAYLTFALYYYLKLKKGYDVKIIGLDLKSDVIRFCQNVAEKLGYTGLSFHVGDIAEWQDNNVDMVITLHACDTATDYALLNAVKWGAKVILSVPCCQHELFSQIKSPLHHPLLKYGILKDKFTELLTDALRGLALEAKGYDVSMIEFTTLEHTSKNILIKATLNQKYIQLCTENSTWNTTHVHGDKQCSQDVSKADVNCSCIKTKRMTEATAEYIALRDYYKAKPTTDKILDL